MPSTLNSTRVTPTLSEAVAAMATEPETVAPVAGEVIETDGFVVSAGVGTVTPTLETAELPAAS